MIFRRLEDYLAGTIGPPGSRVAWSSAAMGCAVALNTGRRLREISNGQDRRLVRTVHRVAGCW